MLDQWEWKDVTKGLDDPRYAAYLSLRRKRRFRNHADLAAAVAAFLVFLVVFGYVAIPPWHSLRWIVLLGVVWLEVFVLHYLSLRRRPRVPIEDHSVRDEIARIDKLYEQRHAAPGEELPGSAGNHATVGLLILALLVLLIGTRAVSTGWGLLLFGSSIATVVLHWWLANRRPEGPPPPPPSRREPGPGANGHRRQPETRFGPATLHGPGLSTNGSAKTPQYGGRR
ncbi:MAG TPA: hypothetical protein VE442_19950 [Jatrophihabitans sp.]|jgi:hypothetical protein|nr:hypothetical protein [Jatrophihabitans sp.]